MRAHRAQPGGLSAAAGVGQGIRSCAHGRYVVFFIASANEVVVVRILHGARDLAAQFGAGETPS